MAAIAAIGAILAYQEQKKEIRRLRFNDEQAQIELSISRDDQTFFNLLDLFQKVVAATDIQE